MTSSTEQRFRNTAASKTLRNIIQAFNLDKKAVLDIGCSYGEFLVHFGKGSVGITIDPEEATYGKARGLDIRRGNIESDNLIHGETFDVVFSNNLLEHLYSPHKFLRTIQKYLKPNGIAIIGVPCVPKIVSLLRMQKFRGSLAEAHINFFTRDTLRITIERAGYTITEVRGFHFANSFVDNILDMIYPHFYVIAIPETNFTYTQKRKKELTGYTEQLC